jgi:hypothetical protein
LHNFSLGLFLYRLGRDALDKTAPAELCYEAALFHTDFELRPMPILLANYQTAAGKSLKMEQLTRIPPPVDTPAD